MADEGKESTTILEPIRTVQAPEPRKEVGAMWAAVAVAGIVALAVIVAAATYGPVFRVAQGLAFLGVGAAIGAVAVMVIAVLAELSISVAWLMGACLVGAWAFFWIMAVLRVAGLIGSPEVVFEEMSYAFAHVVAVLGVLMSVGAAIGAAAILLLIKRGMAVAMWMALVALAGAVEGAVVVAAIGLEVEVGVFTGALIGSLLGTAVVLLAKSEAMVAVGMTVGALLGAAEGGMVGMKLGLGLVSGTFVGVVVGAMLGAVVIKVARA